MFSFFCDEKTRKQNCLRIYRRKCPRRSPCTRGRVSMDVFTSLPIFKRGRRTAGCHYLRHRAIVRDILVRCSKDEFDIFKKINF